MRKFAYWTVALPTVLLITTVSAFTFQNEDEIKIRSEVAKTPYTVEYVFSDELEYGALEKVQHGLTGEIRREYLTIIKDGKVTEDRLIGETVTEPRPAIFHMGKPSNRGIKNATYTRDKVVTMESTAYTPDAGRRHPTFITFTGTKAEYGAIAVDPRVIPLGTLMYVEGYGFGIAEDTGSAIKGNIIDVCIEGRKKALRWGRKDVKVHLFLDEVRVPPSETSSNGTR